MFGFNIGDFGGFNMGMGGGEGDDDDGMFKTT